MTLHRYLYFLIIMISFVACYSTLLQDDPLLSSFVEDQLPYIDGGGAFKKDYIKQSTNVLSLNKFDKLGDTSPSLKTVNVNDYGKTDDTHAFRKAWQAACSSGGANFLVPQKNYLLKPITFTGPCKSNIIVQVSETLMASDNPSDYSQDLRHWLVFDSVQKLSVKGGGTINGNGNIWWKNSCIKN